MSEGMKKILIVIVVLGAIGAVIAAKQLRAKAGQEPETGLKLPPSVVNETKLPRLLELAGGKCLPCKQMIPVIEELRAEYAGTMVIDYINVKEDIAATKEKYNWELIPTQIFYDAEGNELFRHIGFYSKQQILAKWKELGIEISEPK